MVATGKAGLSITLLRVVDGETKFTGAPTAHCSTLQDCRRFLELAYAAWRPKGFTACVVCPKLAKDSCSDLSAGQLDHYSGLWKTVGRCKAKKQGGCGAGQGSAAPSGGEDMIFVTPAGDPLEEVEGTPLMASDVLQRLLLGKAVDDAGIVSQEFEVTMNVAFGLGKDGGAAAGAGGKAGSAAVVPASAPTLPSKGPDSTTAALDLLAAASTGLGSSTGFGSLGLPSASAGAGAAVLPTPDLLKSLGLLTPSMASMFAAGANAKPGDISAAAADMFKLMSAGPPQAGAGAGAGTIPLLAGATPKAGGSAVAATAGAGAGAGAGGAASVNAANAAMVANLAMLSPGLFFNMGAIGGVGAGGGTMNSPLSAAALMTPALLASVSAGSAMPSPGFAALLKALQPSSGETPSSGAAAGTPGFSVEQYAAALQIAKQASGAGGVAGVPTQQHQLPFNVLAEQQSQPLKMFAGGTKIDLVPPAPANPPIRKAPAGGAGRGAAKNKDNYDDETLDMPCVQFNEFIKKSTMSDDEINSLKKARRRKKNRLYAKRSRERKTKTMGQVSELQSKVAELEKAVSPMGIAAAQAAAATQAFGQDAAVAALTAAAAKAVAGAAAMDTTKEEA